jgi:hypothetical protein
LTLNLNFKNFFTTFTIKNGFLTLKMAIYYEKWPIYYEKWPIYDEKNPIFAVFSLFFQPDPWKRGFAGLTWRNYRRRWWWVRFWAFFIYKLSFIYKISFKQQFGIEFFVSKLDFFIYTPNNFEKKILSKFKFSYIFRHFYICEHPKKFKKIF